MGLNRHRVPGFCLSMIFFGKPLRTFPDHALAAVDAREKNNHAPFHAAPARAADPDRRLLDADAQHGPAPESWHLPAALDPRHRHLRVRLYARDRSAESRLGILAAARRRPDG